MSSVIAVDLGKTRARVAMWPGGVSSGAQPDDAATCSGAPGLAETGGVDAAVAAVLGAVDALTRPGHPDQVAVGAAGVSAAPEATRDFATRLRNHWPDAGIVVASDSVTSHAGALGGRPGVVLAAGTGAVVLGVDELGRVRQVDGWGPWLGDDGGGAWIGRAALRAVLVALDGRGPATALTAAAITAFGDDLAGLPAVIGGDAHPVRAMAAFVPAVGEAAVAGDVVAQGILDRAADALSDSVLAAVRFVGGDHVPVALTGGLLDLGAPLIDPLAARLRTAGDAIALVDAVGGSLDGARLLAENADTVHESALIRCPA